MSTAALLWLPSFRGWHPSDMWTSYLSTAHGAGQHSVRAVAVPHLVVSSGSPHSARQLALHTVLGCGLPVVAVAATLHQRPQAFCKEAVHLAAPLCLPPRRYERLVKIMEKYDVDQSGEQPTVASPSGRQSRAGTSARLPRPRGPVPIGMVLPAAAGRSAGQSPCMELPAPPPRCNA